MFKKNKNYILLLLFFLPSLINAQNSTPAWDSKLYPQYTFKTFSELKVANQRIDPKNIDYPLLNAAIFYESNRQRAKYKRPVFKHSKAMEKAAFGHSKDMVKYKFYSHRSKVKGKVDMSDRLALVGIEDGIIAENIAIFFAMEMKGNKSFYPPSQNGGYFSYKYKGKPILYHTYLGFAKELVDGWMHSPGHRQNLLNPDLRFLGCGACLYKPRGRDGVPMFRCTQNFSSSDAGI